MRVNSFRFKILKKNMKIQTDYKKDTDTSWIVKVIILFLRQTKATSFIYLLIKWQGE